MRPTFSAARILLLMMALRRAASFLRCVGASRTTENSASAIIKTMSTATTAEAASSPSSTSNNKQLLQETSTAYKELLAKLQQISHLQHSQALLNYDQLVFMPQSERASAARGAQLAALASIIHEKATAPVIKELISASERDLDEIESRKDESTASDNENGSCKKKSDERILLELAREEYEKNERIPEALQAKRAQLSSTAYAAWVQARSKNDFASFAPVLADCFATARETAQAVRGENEKEKSLYTVMLDEFERNMATERIDAIFDEIEEALVPLLTRVLAASKQNKPSTACLEGTFDVDTQIELNRNIVKQLGFDEEHGRIDVSVHPFTSSFGTADVRITSRFAETEWYQGLAGSIHEAGHALYEQNLGHSNTVLDTFLSMGCHESQSLFWERHVSLSKPFWKWATPQLQDTLFGSTATAFSPEEVYAAVNAVQPGLIRVEADELTYPLHVILRYRIERDVVEGRLAVTDIPQRWNEGMKQMLDVTVPSDAEGCLQDVHWSSLAIGYFPTYLLGAAAAAQLAYYCQKDIVDFDTKIAKGEFAEIKTWLTEKVHRHGRRYRSLDALLEDQLGEKLNPKYLIDYLTAKYTELYKC